MRDTRTASQGCTRRRQILVGNQKLRMQSSVMSQNSSTGTPMRHNSEFEQDELDCLDQYATQNDDGSAEGDHTVAIDQLRKSLNPRLEDETDRKIKEAQAEPID